MGQISDTYANNLLNVGFGGVASAFPAIQYVGLSSTLPADDGTNITEPVDASYDRVAINNDLVTWSAGGLRFTDNLITITFPTALTAWGDIEWFVIMDDTLLAGGSMIGWGTLTTPVTVSIGSTPTFDPNTLVITAPGHNG